MILRSLILLISLHLLGATALAAPLATIASPDGAIVVEIEINGEGRPAYSVIRRGQTIIAPSRLGFLLVDAPKIERNLSLTAQSQRSFDETWEQPWGEERLIRNRYNELRFTLTET